MEKVTSNQTVIVLLTFNDKKSAGMASSLFWSAVADLLPNHRFGESDNPFIFSEKKDDPCDIGIHLFPEFKGRDYACRIVFTGRIGDTVGIVEIKHFREPYVLTMNHFKNDVEKQTRIVFQKLKEISQILSNQRAFFENDFPEAMNIVMPEKNKTLMFAE
jgi:hypothetical protein